MFCRNGTVIEVKEVINTSSVTTLTNLWEMRRESSPKLIIDEYHRWSLIIYPQLFNEALNAFVVLDHFMVKEGKSAQIIEKLFLHFVYD